MKRQKISLNAPERFTAPFKISEAKLKCAVEEAAKRLEIMGKAHGVDFPGCWAIDYKYDYKHNRNWVGGMYAGCYWLAYELTGESFFKKHAEALTATFRERLDKRIGVDDHDVGFAFSPSCVAGYRITGDEAAKQIALDAAEYFYGTGYSQRGKYIIRDWKGVKEGKLHEARTMMDSLMNAPLLFWATEVTGDPKYAKAAHDHVKTTEELLIREDSSSFHHYQFDINTDEPLYGLTLQGHSNDSCWSRGHSWGVYGFPIAYSYDKSDFIKEVHHDVTYFMLNHLPTDLIPAWDYDFTGDNAIKDSSAGVIAVCGMDEMAKMLPDADADKAIFNGAAARILDATIDRCTGERGVDYDGLIFHVTAALPQKLGVDQTAVYGDYFYLEALARFLKGDKFIRYW